MISKDKNGLYHPCNEREISDLVKYAIENKKRIRVRGAGQSVAGSISDEGAMTLQLDQIRHISFDEDNYQVTVGAGINLDYDPTDPSCTSNKLNGLYRLLDKHGWAIPNVPDAAHQTVGGYISTGSSGPTMRHSFDDSIIAIKLVDGTGHVKKFLKSDNPDDEFFGIGSSVGLMGVIYEVTLQCLPKFNVIGNEVTTNSEDAPFNIFGDKDSDRPGVVEYYQSNEYIRTMWWPFKTLHRTVIWSARRMNPEDFDNQTSGSNVFEPKPYVPIFPKLLGDRYASELLASTMFTFISSWPSWLKPVLQNVLGLPKEKVDVLAPEIEQLVGAMAPQLYPLMTDFYFPVDSKESPSQKFWDYWLKALPMDSFEFSNPLMNLDYTELWIPSDHAEQALKVLHDYYQKGGEEATGFYTVEILGSKESPFWLSPGYGQDCIRLNFLRFASGAGSPVDFYYQYYQLFKKHEIPFRFHLGKSLPGKEIKMWANYIRDSYPKMNDFEKLRKSMDPHNLFLTEYWQKYLLLS